MQFILLFKIIQGKTASAARNWINSSRQTVETTFLLSLSFFYGSNHAWNVVLVHATEPPTPPLLFKYGYREFAQFFFISRYRIFRHILGFCTNYCPSLLVAGVLWRAQLCCWPERAAGGEAGHAGHVLAHHHTHLHQVNRDTVYRYIFIIEIPTLNELLTVRFIG